MKARSSGENTIRLKPDEADGRVTLVPVSGCRGLYARIDTEDWESWQRAGKPTKLFISANSSGRYYLRYKNPGVRGRLGTVAREIAKARTDEIVQYVDGDILNLSKKNLFLTSRIYKYPHKKNIRFPHLQGAVA